MSFSVSFVGRPDAIKRELENESQRLTGASKEEFDAIRPALEAVIDQNVAASGPSPALHVEANGHASFVDGIKTFGQCSVGVKRLGSIAE